MWQTFHVPYGIPFHLPSLRIAFYLKVVFAIPRQLNLHLTNSVRRECDLHGSVWYHYRMFLGLSSVTYATGHRPNHREHTTTGIQTNEIPQRLLITLTL